MPATATGRGAQVILDGDAQRAARGAYANTYVANARFLEDMEIAGLVADSDTTSDGTTKTRLPANDYLLGPADSGTKLQQSTRLLTSVSRLAAAARTNNRYLLPAMTSPPTVTDSTTADGTLTLMIPWNGGNSYLAYTGTGPFNYCGGLTQPDALGSNKAPSVYYGTVAGSPVNTQGVTYVETVVDAAKVQFQVFAFGGQSQYRVIVNGQYVTFTAKVIAATGPNYITVDFTSVGGRASRNVTLEFVNCDFGEFTRVRPVEGISRPPGKPVRMYVQGDSITAYGGTSVPNIGNNLVNRLGAYLGIRDTWVGGVPGTGYINNAANTQTTAIQRVPDIISARPDIIVSLNGHNDAAFMTSADLQKGVTQWLTALRSNPATASAPIVMCGLWCNVPNGASAAAEGAITAAVTAFNDPDGAWMTGTGSTAAPTGTGNCDVYVSADGVHPNDAGHTYLAGRLADAMMRQVFNQ
jgi:lysophospholipase L1-like esterase